MTVVADSSPLITLARIRSLEILPRLYRTVVITPQVYEEIVTHGAGLAGSAEIAAAKWVEVKPSHSSTDLSACRQELGLGMGELSAIILGRQMNADLIDEIKARKAARDFGLVVLGTVGILEEAFRIGMIADLTAAFRQLLLGGAYVDRRILENTLMELNLPPL